jgi:hypothetical protein
MPVRLAACVIAIVSASCTAAASPGNPDPAVLASSAAPPSSPASSAPPPSGSVSPTAPSSTIGLPPGLATPFGEDVPAGDVGLSELVPAGTDPAGAWYARTSDGDAIVVAWQAPGDPFRTDRGVVEWRHSGTPTLWRPVFAATYPAARHPVLGVGASIADVTGDGSDDALVFAETGGTGACGTYLVIDAGAGAVVFRRTVCDTQIEPSSDPAGLIVTEAVYAHGDPHCCPSATRTTVLQGDGSGTWRTVSVSTAAA